MGNIKRLRYYSKNKCYNEIIMKKASDKQGYQIISLSKNKKRKTYRVHRLIAKTFIENPQNKKEVNHIDGNKSNNCISNLEWCTRSENQIHAYKNKLQIQTIKMKEHSIELGINKDSIHVKMNFELPFSLKKENIANHSKQLIDLIKVGDIVNGYKVINVINEEPCPSGKYIDIDSSKDSSECTLWEEDIETILTKESYMANCYKVGGEENKCM